MKASRRGILGVVLLLVVVPFLAFSAPSQGGEVDPTASSVKTSRYVFQPEKSTIQQSGGFAGVNWTYAIEGQFCLSIDPNTGAAWFARVDASALDVIEPARALDPNQVFNMAGLTGTVIDETSTELTGQTADGSSVLLTLTFDDDLVYLSGETTPPPNSADFFVFTIDAVATRKYGGGTGQPDTPYKIATAEHLNAVGADPNDWGRHFIVTADIDLSGFEYDRALIAPDTDNTSWFERTSFTGVFDGGGHVIANFCVSSTDADCVGLFGYVANPNGQIKNLGLLDPNVSTGVGRSAGSLVGFLARATVCNCFVEAGTVSGYDEVGGLVGQNWHGEIARSYSVSTVCGDAYVGGLVGFNQGAITDCYARGQVAANSRVGGLVGHNGALGRGRRAYSTITNCYSSCGVSKDGESTGGLVGFFEWGEVISSFWDMDASGQRTSDGGTGLTTAEMQTAVTYLGWATCDSDGGWTIEEGRDYPRLGWEGRAGEPIVTLLLTDLLAGTGARDDPYLIHTAEELNAVGLFPCEWNRHFRLMADIDLSGYAGSRFNIIGINERHPFTGVFDGEGHTISNFAWSGSARPYTGLFGYVSDPNGEIRDLGLADVSVDASVEAWIGWYAGSLVGYLDKGTVRRCRASGSVSGWNCVGGLVGYVSEGTIEDCYSTCTIVGELQAGGLVGRNWRGRITNVYAVGVVVGNNASGLVGSSADIASVAASFWDVEASGLSVSGAGEGKTTAEMQTAGTFLEAGWDFVGEAENGTEDIWWIDEGRDYPRLWWEAEPETMR
ncbi:MAG: GLUG motif-containing protein [Planctomycetota bacterium]|jgi:hypothetical protein